MTLGKSLHLSKPLSSTTRVNAVLLISWVACSISIPGKSGPGRSLALTSLCPPAQGPPACVIRASWLWGKRLLLNALHTYPNQLAQRTMQSLRPVLASARPSLCLVGHPWLPPFSVEPRGQVAPQLCASRLKQLPQPPFLAQQEFLSSRSLCSAEASVPKTFCPELMGL